MMLHKYLYYETETTKLNMYRQVAAQTEHEATKDLQGHVIVLQAFLVDKN